MTHLGENLFDRCTIKVHCNLPRATGQVHIYDASLTDRILDLKTEIQDRMGIQLEGMRLIGPPNTQTLKNDKLLGDCLHQKDRIVFLVLR